MAGFTLPITLPLTWQSARSAQFWAGQDRRIYARFYVSRPDGVTWEDLTSYLVSARISLGNIADVGTGNSGVDTGVRQATFELINERRPEIAWGDSLHPRDRNSSWNYWKGVYAPLLWPTREVILDVATVPVGVTPGPADWVRVFHGFMGDSISASSDNGRITIECRDLMKRLQDTYIETVREYGSEAGTPAETVMQQIINDNITVNPPQLYVPVSPGFMVLPYQCEYQSVADALWQIVNQFGGWLGYRWIPDYNDFRLTLLIPPRNKDASSADWMLDWTEEILVQHLDVSDRDVRNALVVTYRNASTGTRENVTVEDISSIIEFGRKAMQIEEADTSLIDSPGEATAFAQAVIHDLKDLTATTRINMPLMPMMDVFDGILVTNPRLSSTQDFYAVESVEHILDFAQGQFRTEVIASGRVVGAHSKWLLMETRPGTPGTPAKLPVNADVTPVKAVKNQIWMDAGGIHIKDADALNELARLDYRSLKFWDYNGVPSIGLGNVADIATQLGSKMAYGLLLAQGEIRAPQAVISVSISDYGITRVKIEDGSIDFDKLENGSVALPKLSEILSVTIPDRFQRCYYKAGTNLVTNPGFETGNLTGWITSGTPTVQSSVKYGGAYAVLLDASGEYVYQEQPASPGEVWGALCWARASTSVSTAKLRLEFRDASGSSLAFSEATVSSYDVWQALDKVATAPTNTAKVGVYGINTYGAANGYMDDFYLAKPPDLITTSYTTFAETTIPATEAVEQIKVIHRIYNPKGYSVTVKGIVNGITKYETSSSATSITISVSLDVRSIGGNLTVTVQAKSATAGPVWTDCEILQNQRLPIRGAPAKYAVTNAIESYCDTTCERACQTTCQVGCQSSCQGACQTGCQVSCQTACQSSCQSTCERTSQGGGGCVVEGTPVTVIVDGRYVEKPVEQVRVGDFVAAYDKEQDALVVAEITSNQKTKTATVYDVITDGGVLTVTGEQPVFVRGRHRLNPEVEFQEFIPARFIQPGDYMLKLLERRWVEVKEIKQRIAPNTWVYNPRSAPVEGYLAKGFLLDYKILS